MKVLLISDIHLEFKAGAENVIKPPSSDVELIILAGDIGGNSADTIEWIANFAQGREVIYVLGNHEYYNNAFPDEIESIKLVAAKFPNIHVLENESFIYKDTVFLGCTLWTDFNLFGNREISEVECKQLADFSFIKTEHGLIQAKDIREAHQQSLLWLTGELEKNQNKKVVVVTHHIPVHEAVSDHYYWNRLTPAFASDLSFVLKTFKPALWLCGHTHDSIDITYESTRVLACPMGYMHENNHADGYTGSVLNI